MKTLSQTYGRPTNLKIEINPKKASITTPQAWESKWNWFYNWQGAMDEAELRWERLPTKDELLAIINTIPWNCIEKAKALNLSFAGCRIAANGEFVNEGVIAYLWSSSPSVDDSNAQYVYLHRDDDSAGGNWNGRGHGFLVRPFLDKSDSSISLSLPTEITIDWKEYILTPKK